MSEPSSNTVPDTSPAVSGRASNQIDLEIAILRAALDLVAANPVSREDDRLYISSLVRTLRQAYGIAETGEART